MIVHTRINPDIPPNEFIQVSTQEVKGLKPSLFA